MIQTTGRFYPPRAWLPRLWLGFLCSLLVLCPGGAEQEGELLFRSGELPILLVAPHGGSLPLRGAPVRSKENSADRQFSAKRDLHTQELAALYEGALEKCFTGRRPSLLSSQIHRKYCDLNREEEAACESPQGRAFYRRFHAVLEREIQRLKKKHGWVLLLDIHGQSAEPIDMMVGTRGGSTLGPWSESLLWSDGGLLQRLQEQAFTTAPAYPKESMRYGGGTIVRRYAAPPAVEAWQLEHGKELRSDLERQKILVRTVAEQIAKHLASHKKSAPRL